MLIEKVIPFATPIWKFRIENDFQKEIAFCYEHETKFISNKKSNQGGYQSPDLNLMECFPSILDGLMFGIGVVANDIGIGLELSNSWININRKNNFNLPHCHPNSAFSGVIYLKTNSTCGKINFRNPTASSVFPINDMINGYFGRWFFSPEPGDVLIFPSYLDHYVEPNLSDEDRISISFNMNDQNYLRVNPHAITKTTI